MNQNTLVHPSLWRVVIYSLILALLSNILLIWISSDDDTFAIIVGIMSGIAAIALAITYHRFVRWLSEALLLTFTVWIANALEFALENVRLWETQVRQVGFYATFALLALGAYVAHREADYG